MPWPGLAATNAGRKSCQTHVHTPLNHNSLVLRVHKCQPLEQVLTLVSRGLFQQKGFCSSVILSAGFSWVHVRNFSLIKKFPLGQLLWPKSSAPLAPSAELLMLSETTRREEYSSSNFFWDTERASL